MTDRGFTDITEDADDTKRSGTQDSVFEKPDKIGRYRITDVIGKGGFGVVFLAVDETLDRQVAIKVTNRVPRGADGNRNWNSEARMVAKLDHPNIVPIYDVGATDDFPIFVVSKFIEGVDLRQRLRQEKPSLSLTVDWAIHMAEALSHSHLQGLIHRDVKPSNILIDKEDRSWLTDFGLALRDEDIGREPRKRTLVGTLSYMSPEQARGEGHLVDGRADIFSLGIVLYEMLLGAKPFSGKSSVQLLWNIVNKPARPLRALDPNVPPELERICMKALSQRRVDRYATGTELANDLRLYQQQQGGTVDHSMSFSLGPAVLGPASLPTDAAVTPSASSVDTRIIPKGLRSFDEHDRSFFLKLVPGPRDAAGVPEVLLRLKQRIESRKLEDSFRVGMLYGSSGSGKSSLVRAGLMPLLDDSVEVVYVEANARNTESRLLSSVAPLIEEQKSKETLPAAMAAIRRGAVKSGAKVVVILDQFEQWLHSHCEMQDAELVRAIRQCDGVNLQCLVLIRDDFWMPATRFFHELEVRLVQGVNSTAVDRFELRHARYVLSEFGRAYGCLPQDPAAITLEQNHFLDAIVAAVQEDGKVISIHLVVIAQMLKGSEWNRKTLAEFGGTLGIDTNFLDATFSDSNASPHHRSMQEPARAVLAALLPEMDTNIKGQMKSVPHLRDVSKLSESGFERLIDALDGELRLITPTVNDEESEQQCYQLTHDFLVPPLREWLTRSDRQTSRGRTKLRLRELSQYWRRKHEKQFLPSTTEFVRMLAFTSAADRNQDEAKLISAATRFYAARWAIAAVVALLVGMGALVARGKVQKHLTVQQKDQGVNRLMDADVARIENAIENLQPVRALAEPTLREIIANPNRQADEKVRARLVLVDSDASHVGPLADATKDASVEQIMLICSRLSMHADQAAAKLWETIESESIDETSWLRTALAIAQLDPRNERWAGHSDRLARTIVNQRAPMVIQLAPGFATLAPYLVEPTKAFYDAPHRDEVRVNAAYVLSKCLSASDPMLAEMIATGTPAQFELLVSVAAAEPKLIVPVLERELLQRAGPQWPPLSDANSADANSADVKTADVKTAVLDDAVRAKIRVAGGIIDDAFILLQQIAVDDFDALASELDKSGYRPSSVRGYRSKDQTWIAAIMLRDNKRWTLTRHVGPDDIQATDAKMRESGMLPTDLTDIPSSDPETDGIQYGVLWTQPSDSVIDARLYVGVTQQDHQDKGWGPMHDGGFKAKTNLKLLHPDGTDRYSSLRWRTTTDPISKDSWNNTDYDYTTRLRNGWHQIDIRLNQPGQFDDASGVSFSDVWYNGGPMESRTLSQLTAKEHLTESRVLADSGFRPVCVSLVEDENGRQVAASVWHRPFASDLAKDEVASRKANAVIALLRLGETQYLWPLLESTPDPRVRSFLIDRLASLGADPQILLHRLAVESNESRLFAIIASLSHYRLEQLTSKSVQLLQQETLRLGSEHSAAAIHAICGYLSQTWGWEDVSQQIEKTDVPRGTLTSSPQWSRNNHGHTMVSIAGPVNFQIGSPGNENLRDHAKEAAMQVRIPRSFAISSAEVTAHQFLKFDSTVDYSSKHTMSRNCPITQVRFVDAIRYCRWLSEQEGIEEDQMCYPPLDEISDQKGPSVEIELPSNFLKRTGYRLPTEAEWEYAGRSLASTSRHFGNSEELLPKYAWTTETATVNSVVQFQPVKRLLPNDFGLFDTLGNVMEWTSKLSQSRDSFSRLVVDDDSEMRTASPANHVLCGSAAFYVSATMRSANREWSPVESHPYVGFRVARTLPEQ